MEQGLVYSTIRSEGYVKGGSGMTTTTKGVRYFNGKYRWEACYQGKRTSGSATTLDEAINTRETALTTLRTGRQTAEVSRAKLHTVKQPSPITSSCPTLLEAVTQMLNTDWQQAKSLRTIKINAEKMLDYFGTDIRLSEIDNAAIDRYIQYCQVNLRNANGTINRKVSLLSSILKKAVKKGYIDSMPYIERYPESEGRVRFITPEEEAEILNLLARWGKERERDAVIALIDTGIRTGELYKLATSDVDLTKGSHGVIFLHETKNGTSRVVPLTERARNAILRLISTSNDPERVLPENEQWLRYTWDAMKRHLGKDSDKFLVPHILRHTCCSRLVQKGAPLKKVQAWLGHKSILTTMRYAHLAPTDLYEMTELLEQTA